MMWIYLCKLSLDGIVFVGIDDGDGIALARLQRKHRLNCAAERELSRVPDAVIRIRSGVKRV